MNKQTIIAASARSFSPGRAEVDVIYFTAHRCTEDDDVPQQAWPRQMPTSVDACATTRSVGRKDVKPEFAAHYNRGLRLERSGKYEQAAEAFGQAICSHPLDIDARVHLGLILRELGRDEEANRIFLAALDLSRGAALPPSRRKGELPFDASS